MPVVTSTLRRPRSWRSSPSVPRAAMCSAAAWRSSDFAEAEARWAARSVAQASRARPTMTASRRPSGPRSEEIDPRWKKASLTTVAMSQACATTRSAVMPPTAMARTTKRLVVRA